MMIREERTSSRTGDVNKRRLRMVKAVVTHARMKSRRKRTIMKEKEYDEEMPRLAAALQARMNRKILRTYRYVKFPNLLILPLAAAGQACLLGRERRQGRWFDRYSND